MGLRNGVSRWLRERREQKLDRILKELCDKVNELPRGYGYYNVSYPGQPANDHYTNVQLYLNELQIIEDEFNQVKSELEKLYKNNPQLRAKVEKVKAELEERASIYNKLRENGAEISEEDINRLFDLEAKYYNSKGIIALGANNGLNAAEKKRINDELDRAQNELEKLCNYQDRQKLREDIEMAKVELMDNIETWKEFRVVRAKPSLAERLAAVAEKGQAENLTKTKNEPKRQRERDNGPSL